MRLEQNKLFVSEEDKRYHTFRIPALAITQYGTILAFAEGRRNGSGDAGEIDIVLKRSFDNGENWEPIQRVVTELGMTCGNPCPVVDHNTGTIWLPFCKNPADSGEELITQGKAARTVWMTSSTDGGLTWARPYEITDSVKNPDWTWYATGPGHGIQLRSGRLLVPCNHRVGKHFDRERDLDSSHVIYSDDHGKTWQIGGSVENGTNECAVTELRDGSVYISCRNYAGKQRRAVAWSHDGGNSFTDFRWEDRLIDPVCQASLIRVTHQTGENRSPVLFTNPANTERQKLTVRASYDECQSWPIAKTLFKGEAAYSDMAVTPDGAIHCLYECGKEGPYEMLRMATFDLEWVEI